MLIDNFDFDLPKGLIAQFPAKDKSKKKMMIYQQGKISSGYFSNILDFLQAKDVLVFNDVKVLKAKLYAKIAKNGSLVEFNLDQEVYEDDLARFGVGIAKDLIYWMAICKGSKKLKESDIVEFGDDFTAKVIKKFDDGFCILSFDKEGFFEGLDKVGEVPLPPYIKRSIEDDDQENYQTIYAKKGAGVAAPTAGLHFDEEIFTKLEEKGVKKAFVTLNVGAGTFLPVRTQNILDHKMHEEYCEISNETAKLINEVKENGGRVVAVGTTSLRVLESVADNDGSVKEFRGKTDIFIYPGYEFKMIDGLFTNFHLPKSTLFMLVCAFIGSKNAKELYEKAIKEELRFFSYGDSSLLLP